MAQMMLTDRFNGWLMSDGYAAYRHYDKRFRCLAHLYRKARSLAQSTDRENKRFGDLTMNLLQSIMSRIKQARINNEFSIISDFRYRLFIFKAHCLKYRKSQSAKAQALAKEFLNDWDAIFRILSYPEYPMTNNEAERALRHWVIVRRISLGSQSQLGAEATALLASVIETSKKRGEDVINASLEINNSVQMAA
ncbi:MULTISPECIES: IS66 family transposase, partial [Cysteiniphilum]|uniref:IS66 family transposase n=1 Tax=Cysteiniphilum TaxID=2056696 RepID=UPI001CE2C524